MVPNAKGPAVVPGLSRSERGEGRVGRDDAVALRALIFMNPLASRPRLVRNVLFAGAIVFHAALRY